jgi:hypothetical protein
MNKSNINILIKLQTFLQIQTGSALRKNSHKTILHSEIMNLQTTPTPIKTKLKIITQINNRNRTHREETLNEEPATERRI